MGRRRPPAGGYQSPLVRLVAGAQVSAARAGEVRMAGDAWLAAAELTLRLGRACGRARLDDTPEALVAGRLEAAGLAWRWEGDDLLLSLPGWVPPPPCIVAVQPRLFEPDK